MFQVILSRNVDHAGILMYYEMMVIISKNIHTNSKLQSHEDEFESMNLISLWQRAKP